MDPDKMVACMLRCCLAGWLGSTGCFMHVLAVYGELDKNRLLKSSNFSSKCVSFGVSGELIGKSGYQGQMLKGNDKIKIENNWSKTGTKN